MLDKLLDGFLGGPEKVGMELLDGATFDPFTLTTSVGRTGFDGNNFNVSMSPMLQALMGGQMDQMQGLFGQGVNALNAPVPSVDQLTSQYFDAGLQTLLPQMTQANQMLQEQLAGTGTGGLMVSGEALGLGQGSGAVNPMAAALSGAQSNALTDLFSRSRLAGLNEQNTLFGQNMNRANALFSGGQGMFGNLINLLGLEQGLLNQGAGLEQLRAGTMRNAYYQPQMRESTGSQLFGSFLSGAAQNPAFPFPS